MKKILKLHITKIVLLTFIFSVLFSSVYLSAQCAEISNEVLRLHILANSNSQEDQTLKINLRDYLLEETSDLFLESHSKEESINVVDKNLSKIENLAQEYIYSQGYDYDVKVEIEKIYFNTRIYDGFAMPPGEYDALRILIGSGEGENWWCVMYPPVCLPAAENNEELEEVLDENQMEIVENEPEYEIKFKVFEIFDSVENFIKSF